MKIEKKLFIGLCVLAIITPLGLWLPEVTGAGSAWGEWSSEEVADQVGYAPDKMQENEGNWNAPIPDYSLGNPDEASKTKLVFSYIFSAIAGIVICGGLMWLFSIFFSKRKLRKGKN